LIRELVVEKGETILPFSSMIPRNGKSISPQPLDRRDSAGTSPKVLTISTP
jgi:hypothetical protein